MQNAALQSEAKLIQACRDEDPKAWEELYRRVDSDLSGVVSMWASNKEEIADICQDVRVSIFKSLDSFRGESALSTWVYRIAVRAAQRAKSKRTPLVEELWDKADAESSVFWPDETEESWRGLSGDEQREILRTAIGALEQDCQFALAQYYFEDVEVAEIGRAIGRSLQGTYNRINYCKRKLADVAEELFKKHTR